MNRHVHTPAIRRSWMYLYNNSLLGIVIKSMNLNNFQDKSLQDYIIICSHHRQEDELHCSLQVVQPQLLDPLDIGLSE